MSGKIINLNRARKDRARSAKAVKGDANAARFGRSKAERDQAAKAADKAARDLDGHKREE